MATVKVESVKKADRVSALEAKKAAGYTSLAGNELPLGKHSFLTADKNAFGILDISTTKDGKPALFALPIVAGTLTTEQGKKISYEISAKGGAQTMVVPDRFFIEMQTNFEYAITVEKRNGRNVVTDVAVGIEVPAGEED